MHKHASANRFYRLVWSTLHGCWVAVAEGARSHGKGGARRRAAAAMSLLAGSLAGASALAAAPALQASALPTGMQLVAGQAGVSVQGNKMTISQATQQAIMNWQGFDIGANAQVRFNQPNASAVALNRVVGGEATTILGKLSSNGKVFLVNPQGVLFGAGAQVDVGGLVASSLGLSDQSFLSGSYAFRAEGAAGAVRNEGAIRAPGGVVALLAPTVVNSGSISAQGGSVALAAGRAVGLDFRGDGLITVRVEQGALDALAENQGLLQADNGQVLLTARAAEALARSTVNNSGVVQARGLVADGGSIRLVGDGQVYAGTLDASAAKGHGGSVAIEGGRVALDGTLRADGLRGGSVAVKAAGELSNAAELSAAGSAGQGGSIVLASGAGLVENSAASASVRGATDGGSIALLAGGSLLSSGRHDAQGVAGSGGRVDLGGADVRLLGTRVDASGATQGGLVRVGGAFQGGAADPDAPDAQRFSGRWGATAAIANADATFINDSTLLDVSARGAAGQGGTAIVWSEKQTTMLGAIKATGAASGGAVEISGKEDLRYVGLESISLGRGGHLLLDPKNIVIGNYANVWTYDAILGKGFSGGKNQGVSGLDEGDGFGYSVALTSDGKGLAVGAPFDDGLAGAADKNYGAVRLFTFSGDNFSGASLAGTIGHGFTGGSNVNMAASLAGQDMFGSSVALSKTGDVLAVGALGADLAGKVYTFSFGSGFSTPVLKQTISSATYGAGSGFGVSVALNGAGDKLAVGALYANGVELFTGAGGIFGSVGAFSGGTSADAQFGTAVALNEAGTQLAVGAPGENNARGMVYLYNTPFAARSLAGTIGQGGSKANITLREGALFGSALAINDAGTRLVVGEPGNGGLESGGPGPGAVRVFDMGADFASASLTASLGRDYTQGTDISLDLDNYGNFGFAVAINGAGDGLVVGQPFTNSSDGTTAASGAVSVFRLVPAPAAGSLTFNHATAKAHLNASMDAQKLAEALAAGTSITLQANNDITWESGSAINAGGSGNLTLQAGRSIALNSDITMGGTLNAVANASTPAGVVNANRAAGDAAITVGNGNSISADNVNLTIGTGAGQTYSGSGDITIGGTVRGKTVRVVNQGPSAGSDVIINAGGSLVGSGGNGAATVVVVAGGGAGTGTFTNNRGANALQGGADGYYHVYADSPQNVLEGLSGYSKHYNQSYTGSTPSYASGANWFMYKLAPTLTVSAQPATKVYDGSSTLPVFTYNPTGFIDGDVSAGFTGSAAATGFTKNVGTYGLNIGTLASSLGYVINFTGGTLQVTPRQLTVSATGINKVYDGLLSAGVTLGDNRVAGDQLTASAASSVFGDKNAGSGKAVSVSGIALSGTDAGNYTLASTSAATTANITQRTLNVHANAADKVYDGGLAASVTLGDDRVAGDTLSLSSSGAAFGDKNAGTGKAVQVSGIAVAGTDAGNYALASTSAASSAAITPRQLTVGMNVANKVYDGGVAAVASFTDNRLGADVLSVSGSAAFADKNAGNGKTVTASGLALSGADAGNYTLASATASGTAAITPRALALTVTGANKVYDGGTAASVSFGDDRVAGDTLTVAGSASFADKNVGNGKAISVAGIALSGTDAANYSLAGTTAATTGNITPRTLTVGTSGGNKIYDGGTAATVTLTDDRVAGDTLALASGSAAFTDKNAGSGKALSVGGITVGGADAGNYVLASTTATGSADIAARSLAVTAGGVDRTYDGSTAATVTFGDDRVAGDVLAVSGNAAFADKNAGNGKAVNVSGIALSGADAGNYVLASSSAATTANIGKRTLNASATGVDKVYDQGTAASVTLGDDRVAGDLLALTYSGAAFADKNAGSGKSISVSGIALGGTDAGNYTLASSGATANANIDKRTLAVTGVTAANKQYDGSTAASASYTDDRLGGDVLSIGGTAVFADKNAGTGKTVTASGLALSGTDAGNYVLASTSVSTSADITTRTLNIDLAGSNKVYDGTTSVTVAFSDDRVQGDILTVSGSGTFADKHVGTGKTIQVGAVTLAGADAANYTVSGAVATTSGDITRRTLVVNAVGANKVYDGTTAASATLGDDRVAGDVLSVTGGSASFADKNAGSGKALSVSGIALSGADKDNYVLASSTASGSADITARSLTASATGVNRVYDGSTAASVIFGDNRVAGDELALSGNAVFADKNAGNGKAVSVSGISLSGADAGNYTLAGTTASTSANITQRALAVTATAANKAYDQTAAASAVLGDNRVSGDALTLAYGAAAFSDKNAGNGKNVSITGITLGGTDAGNYSLASASASATADITPRALTVNATGSNKVYDGSVAAVVNYADNRLAGDVLSVSGNAVFANKNAGNGKAITVSGLALAGADAANYALTAGSATASGDITQRTLNVSTNGTTKVYDGTVAAQLSFADNRVAGDTLVLSGSGSYADKNAGSGKVVNASGITLGGADAANYQLAATTATGTGSITPRALTVNVTAASKVYDGGTATSVALAGDNRIAGDQLTLAGGSGSFADKNVGNNKAVSLSGVSLSGADAANYTVSVVANSTASITPRALQVSATGIDKVYDGTLAANVAYADNRLSGDSLQVSGNAAFADKNAGQGKAITVSGISLSGADAGNYSVGGGTSTTASITPKALTAIANGSISKVYDGGTAAQLAAGQVGLAGFASGEGASVGALLGQYNSANVQGANSVTAALQGGSVSAGAGTLLSNYVLPANVTLAGSISARQVSIGGVAVASKTYDGTTNGSLSSIGSLSGLVNGEGLVLQAPASVQFENRNAGNGKVVTASGYTLANGSGLASNYVLANSSVTTTGNIAQASLVVRADDQVRAFGNANPALTWTASGLVGGDTAALLGEVLTSTGAGLDAPAGSYAINISGNSLQNYAVSYVNGVLTVARAPQQIENLIGGLVNPAAPMPGQGGGMWAQLGNGGAALVSLPDSSATQDGAQDGSAAGSAAVAGQLAQSIRNGGGTPQQSDNETREYTIGGGSRVMVRGGGVNSAGAPN
ncbi:filamentous hemagglutinin N-terminal domain-containing protein [Pseudoduganella sp. DS3]|uniref:Filamentous hemagglutinin N-terminal domain-containing protein n=1 Tax=Pseudoduganella guangdongensis TaxID=2692179 RepID=A0A6N9HLC0_9BURK|nr:YDG domain-containing protein [Pseudoduganella guangdongensis]MYN04448.1 filamentous hemagglutinin N-terminal domain-containing protein [Pseudoduganella guangdongensis]